MSNTHDNAEMTPGLEPGAKVVIMQNPHDIRAERIVGTVIVFRADAGFGASDLVDVHYKHPLTGDGLTQPFGMACLAEPTPALLVQLAEQLERQAAALRGAAKQK
jgi:hypothetical protein